MVSGFRGHHNVPASARRLQVPQPRSLRNLHPNQPGRCPPRAELGSRQPCLRLPSGQAWTEGSSQRELLRKPCAVSSPGDSSHMSLRCGPEDAPVWNLKTPDISFEKKTKVGSPSLCHLGVASGCVRRSSHAGASAGPGSSSRGTANRFGERRRVVPRAEDPSGVVVLALECGWHSRQELAA